jgi:hypothetical protein
MRRDILLLHEMIDAAEQAPPSSPGTPWPRSPPTGCGGIRR